MSDPVASVVIGFKNWGIERLDTCIASIHESFQSIPCEVIVSDYGSTDGDAVERAASKVGARYLRTESDETWSRSRALNAGFSIARGEQFFATDADMIFQPGTLESISRRLQEFPAEAIILQCRDLPPSITIEALVEIDWAHLERISTLRPRWGMGGLVATHREIFSRLRGYDERMHTYGGEDMDYGKRLRQYGAPINWLDQPCVRMYHVWHASTRLTASLDGTSIEAVAHNRRIYAEDETTSRNRIATERLSETLHPLVSIVVVADRPAQVLAPEVSNLLDQTVTDIEILLVDTHGQALATTQQIGDDRVRVVPCPGEGWWRAIALALGSYTLLHGPGQWPAPNRLESLLDCTSSPHVMPADVSLTVTSGASGAQIVPTSPGTQRRRPWASALMPTMTAQTVLALLGPEVTDPNDLIFALLRNGLSVASIDEQITAEVVTLESLVEVRAEELDRSAQRLWRRLGAADLARDWMTAAPTPAAARVAAASLPDLVEDEVDLVIWSSDEELLNLAHRTAKDEGRIRKSLLMNQAGEVIVGILEVVKLPGTIGRRIRRIVTSSSPHSSVRVETSSAANRFTRALTMSRVIQELSRRHPARSGSAAWVAVHTRDEAGAVSAAALMSESKELDVVLRIELTDASASQHLALGLTDARPHSLRTLLGIQAMTDPEDSVELWIGEDVGDVRIEDLAGGES